MTLNLTNRRNGTKTGTEGSLRCPVYKSNDALQACCFEVTWIAGAWRERDFNQKQATYPGGRIDPPPSPLYKLEDRLEQTFPTVLGGRTPLIRKICSRTTFEIYLNK